MSNLGAEWYKREPAAYLFDVQGFSAKEHAVYAVVLDLIYAHGGSTRNDPKFISGFFSDMGSAAIRKALTSLADRGCLIVSETEITQKRAKSEAKTKENLRETNRKSGEKGGKKSAEIRAARNENNNLGEATASGKIQPDKIREESSSSSSAGARGSPDPDEAPPLDPSDQLFDDVLAAAGIKGGTIPAYWMPPAAAIHVQRWQSDLGLTHQQIVDVCRACRKRHPDPPSGPKAFDRAMQHMAAELKQPIPQIQNQTTKRGRHDQNRFGAAMRELERGLSDGTVRLDVASRDPFQARSG